MHEPNYLKANREQLALTLDHVGRLLGLSDSTISGYEQQDRIPGLEHALGLEIVFGKPLGALFHDLKRTVAEAMIRPAQNLSIEFEAEEGPSALKRQTFILTLGDRLASILPNI
jgi:transcriptional regulator with XRE-family HTH domain